MGLDLGTHSPPGDDRESDDIMYSAGMLPAPTASVTVSG